MSEKTHQPTAKKLADAHRRGEVAKSKDLTSFAFFIGVVAFVWLASAYIGRHFVAIVQHAIDAPRSTRPSFDWFWLGDVQSILYSAIAIVAPGLVAGIACATVVGALQTRGVFSMRPLGIRFDRISPAQGLTRLFSSRQLFEVVMLVLKSGLLTAILVGSVIAALDGIVKMTYAPPGDLIRIAGTIVFGLVGWAAVVYAAGASVDYAFQLHEFLKSQKMSTDELRRESRESEGDPHLKSHRRATAREVATTNLISRVEDASVVLVNPTHVSVALYFAKGKTDLPRVVAKGVDALALRIRTEAARSGVPIFEDVALTRRVFREVGVNQYINEGLIDSIAAVFRWAKTADRRIPKSDGAPPRA